MTETRKKSQSDVTAKYNFLHERERPKNLNYAMQATEIS